MTPNTKHHTKETLCGFRAVQSTTMFLLLVKDQFRQLTSQPDSIPDCQGGNKLAESSGVKASGCCAWRYRTVREASKLEGHNVKECLPWRKCTLTKKPFCEVDAGSRALRTKVKAEVIREELVRCT